MRRFFRRLLTAIGRWGFTVMIVPRRGYVRRVVVPWMGVIAIGLFCLMVGYFIGYYPYGQYKSSDQNQTIDRLRQINERLTEENEEVKPALERYQQIEELLNRYENEINATKSAYESVSRKASSRLSSRSGSYRPPSYRLPDPVVVMVDGEISLLETLEKDTDSLLAQLNKQLDETVDLKKSLLAYERQLDHTPSIYPIQGRFSSSFGYRVHPITGKRTFHDGVDLAAPRGTRVRATADGVVKSSCWRSGYGQTIIISHGYGYETLYGHNDKLLVKAGQAVKKGQVIAYSGSTGSVTGPHLHYEVRVYGNPVNPTNYMR